MLGVLQFLYFVEAYPVLAAQVHALSRKQGNEFPLACVGFHFTLSIIRGLRAGAFDRMCVRRDAGCVGSTMADIYVAMFFRLEKMWKVRTFSTNIEAIQHFNPIKDRVIESITRDAGAALKSLRAHHSQAR